MQNGVDVAAIPTLAARIVAGHQNGGHSKTLATTVGQHARRDTGAVGRCFYGDENKPLFRFLVKFLEPAFTHELQQKKRLHD